MQLAAAGQVRVCPAGHAACKAVLALRFSCSLCMCAAQNTIRSAGETVQAEEVEAVLPQHPFIVAAAVVGLQHPRWGEQASSCSRTLPLLARALAGRLRMAAGLGAECASVSPGMTFSRYQL